MSAPRNMSGRKLFKFVDASPAHTRVERYHIKAEASAHAARVSHQRRRKADERNLRAFTDKPAKTSSDANNKATNLRSLDVEVSVATLESVPHGSSHLSCSACRRELTSRNLKLDSQHTCRDDFEQLAAIHNYPATWSDWTTEDVADLQFFMNVFGSSVRNLSDGGFFNIVVPCLVGSDIATRNLLLAVASTHRNISCLKAGRRRAAQVRAFEKCNKGIRRFSKDFSLASPEVSLTCCILLTVWYMFRLDPKAAEVCIRAAESMSQMDRTMRLKCRLLSARNATDPQSSSNYQKSTFASITAGTVAKLALQLSYDNHDSILDSQVCLSRLEISSEGLRLQIRDMHDLLSSVESFYPLFEQLRMNIAYYEFLNHNSVLAQDLLARLGLIAKTLEQATPLDEHRSFAIGILWQWYRVYSIGIRCQILSNSEISWDNYLCEFLLMTEWYEEYLPRIQDEQTYVFLPVGIIVRPLWFTAVHCRDPDIRSRAIAALLKYHRNETGIDSWIAGHIAQELMVLEHGGREVWCASDIAESDRVLLRGFEVEGEGLCLLYVYATDIETLETLPIFKRRFAIPKDPHGVVQMWEEDGCNIDYLNMLSVSVGQTFPEAMSIGRSVAMFYDEEPVEVVLPERKLPLAQG